MSPIDDYTTREWWTLGELASSLHVRLGRRVHMNTLYSMAKDGRLPTATKMFGQWRVHRDALEHVLGGLNEQDKSDTFTLGDRR
jgi:hypothetical protein